MLKSRVPSTRYSKKVQGIQKNGQPICGIKKLHFIKAMESKFIFKYARHVLH